jgi:hypothetical protein
MPLPLVTAQIYHRILSTQPNLHTVPLQILTSHNEVIVAVSVISMRLNVVQILV